MKSIVKLYDYGSKTVFFYTVCLTLYFFMLVLVYKSLQKGKNMIDQNDKSTIDLYSETVSENTVKVPVVESKSLQNNTVLRQRKKKYELNPFVDDELMLQLSGLKNVRYTQTSRNAIVDTETGNYEPATLQVVKTIRADKEKFVKLYTTHLRVFFELTANSNKLLQYIFHKVQTEAKDKDTIYINYVDADEFYKSHNLNISESAFFKGLKELVEKQFLAYSNKNNLFFINPKLFFNGDRVQFITAFECDNVEVLTQEEYKKLEGEQE